MDDGKVTVEHTGGCHCGSVKFSARASSKVKVYDCNCTICVKKHLRPFIIPKKNFKLLQGQDNLKLYTYNTGAAKHYFCKTCGVQSFYEPRSVPDGVGVMTSCIDSKTLDDIEEIPFDGKNWDEAIKGVSPSFN